MNEKVERIGKMLNVIKIFYNFHNFQNSLQVQEEELREGTKILNSLKKEELDKERNSVEKLYTNIWKYSIILFLFLS